MLTAPRAILFVLHPPRLLLLVLGGGVVPAFALRAFECDNVSHTSLGSIDVVPVTILLPC